MLPNDPRSFLGPASISVSEIGSLAACEMKWHLSYGQAERPEQSQSAAMARGTEVHRLVQHWRLTGGVLPSEDEMAAWLIGRYAEHYTHDRWTVHAIEQPFAVKLDGWNGHLFGFFDGLIETNALWLHEIKTMARWDRLAQLPVDRQVSLYIWAARQSGIPVKGVCFDAIRTHRPVRKELPLAESFERVWIERTDEELAEAVVELESALHLRDSIQAPLHRRPIRNVGSNCSWCSVVTDCFGIEVDVLPESD